MTEEWSSRFMRQYETDVKEAEELTNIPQGMDREDIRERQDAVRKLQQKYKSNKYAEAEFEIILERLKSKEGRAKKRSWRETAVQLVRGRANSTAIYPDRIYDHPVVERTEERTLHDIVIEVIDPGKEGTTRESREKDIGNMLMLEDKAQNKEQKREPFSTLPYFGRNNLMDVALQAYKEAGVIGEEKNLVIATLCIANGLHLCMEGPSGSGKSKVIGAVMELVQEEDIYRLELASETAVMNDVETINRRKILYIPELQKAYQGAGGKVPMIAEIIKGMTEGRDVTRRVTIKQGSVASYTINPDHTIVTTLAFENIFKYDEETARRLKCTEADTSEEHKMMVRAAKAEEAFMRGREQRDEKRREMLSAYMHDLIHHHGEIAVIDPFSAYMQQYIPLTQRSASFQAHYNDLVAAAARFNQNRRYEIEGEGKTIKTVFTTLQDQQLIFDIYYAQMLTAMERLDKKDDDTNKIREIRERLEREKGVDWTACLADGRRRMQEVYPQHADRWEAQMR
ncbi:hypothetical protein HZA99_06200 [Candidatus Woesearchaeota archaeon]|nr:hypothetical protein [Candidatus Woesearchaeota archaeon]